MPLPGPGVISEGASEAAARRSPLRDIAGRIGERLDDLKGRIGERLRGVGEDVKGAWAESARPEFVGEPVLAGGPDFGGLGGFGGGGFGTGRAGRFLQNYMEARANRAGGGGGTLVGTLERGNINANIEGGVPDGYAGHHLIPVSTAEKFAVMERAAELGYDINRGSNGIALPRTVELAQESGLPLHSGRHTGAYFDYVRGQLDRLQSRYDAGSVTDATLLREVGRIENRIRRDLLSHKVKLQYDDPH